MDENGYIIKCVNDEYLTLYCIGMSIPDSKKAKFLNMKQVMIARNLGYTVDDY